MQVLKKKKEKKFSELANCENSLLFFVIPAKYMSPVSRDKVYIYYNGDKV